MLELSMHILDIVENSITSGADVVTILIEENHGDNVLKIEIKDNGEGMDELKQKMAVDPFFTTKEKKVGLGLPLLVEAAKRTQGNVQITTHPGQGTSIKATFGLTHLDRQPLGDIIETMVVLIVSHPKVEFSYCYIHDGKKFSWDTQTIQDHFKGVPFHNPQVVQFIRDELKKMYI